MSIRTFTTAFRSILGARSFGVLIAMAVVWAPAASIGGDAPSFDRKNSRYVVFIHTGGGDSALGAKLASMLLDAGMQVPRPDDYRDTIGGAGVDYFSRDDVEMAAFVADQANKLLPPNSAPLKPRFQSSVRNPPGFLGVWLYSPWSQSAVKEPADWMAKPPAAAYCYQEYDPATRQFLTACHFSQTNCQTARGANNEKPGTGCAFTDLGKAVWNPHPGGYLRSWYQFWDGEVGDPFPQIDPALLAKAKAAAGSN